MRTKQEILDRVKMMIKAIGRDYTNSYISREKMASDYNITVNELEMLLELANYYRECDGVY